jgi:hypothetical protein
MTGLASDYFGVAVSISGDYAIVGANGDDIGANTEQGSAYLYKRDGINWTLMRKIEDDSGQASDILGYSVSLNGFNLIIGAPRKNGKGGASFLNIE